MDKKRSLNEFYAAKIHLFSVAYLQKVYFCHPFEKFINQIKTIMRKQLLLIVLIVLPMVTNAYDIEKDGIY